MFKILKLLLLFFAVAFAGIWLKENNFPISATFLNYQLQTSLTKLAILALLALFVIYAFFRVLFLLKNSPSSFANRLQQDRQKQARKDLLAGFSALAAGDIGHAKKLAERSEKGEPENTLTKFLQAQIALISANDEEAEKHLQTLSKQQESCVLGYRGLIALALKNNETARALALAEQLQKKQPNSQWVNAALIDLTFREDNLEKAEKQIIYARKSGAIDRKKEAELSAVIGYLQAKKSVAKQKFSSAIIDLEKATKSAPSFLPAQILLAECLLGLNRPSSSAEHVEKAYKLAAHPRLAEIYEKALRESLKDKPEKIAKKVAKLFASNPVDQTNFAWICSETGAPHQHWQLHSDSGFFNTISWAARTKTLPNASTTKNAMDSFVLIK